MLVYLIEMADVETGDIQSGRWSRSSKKRDQNKLGGIAVWTSGQIQLEPHEITDLAGIFARRTISSICAGVGPKAQMIACMSSSSGARIVS
jgi:hypothetical protein